MDEQSKKRWQYMAGILKEGLEEECPTHDEEEEEEEESFHETRGEVELGSGLAEELEAAMQEIHVAEGMGVDENEYFRMKKRLEKDISTAYYKVEQAIAQIYDESEDPIDTLEEVMEVLGRHVR